MSGPLIRPGPMSIEPGANPGGVVIHAYSVPGQVLLLTSKVGLGDDVAKMAGCDADFVSHQLGGADVCLVAFDGDSGERMQW